MAEAEKLKALKRLPRTELVRLYDRACRDISNIETSMGFLDDLRHVFCQGTYKTMIEDYREAAKTLRGHKKIYLDTIVAQEVEGARE